MAEPYQKNDTLVKLSGRFDSTKSLSIRGGFLQLFVECDEFSFEMESEPELTGIVRGRRTL
jgi:hypothetical protein